MKMKMLAAAIIAGSVTGNVFGNPQEEELAANLKSIFEKSAAHYTALEAAARPLNKDGKEFPHGYDPKTGKYKMWNTHWWTSGHFSGSLWYLYEATGEKKLRELAEYWTLLNADNSKVTDNHDVGFIMYCSFGNWIRIAKDDEAAMKRSRELLIETANSLCQRYNEKLGLIRSWGPKDGKNDFLVIPDNMMNLEMLMWVSKATGDSSFAEKAMSHADVTMKNHFRPDGGCYHVLNYDQRDQFLGQVMEIRRGQGLCCTTAWSRGQSWAIYGYTMMYRMTGRDRYLKFARKLADYAMTHPNMPADGIPYWDYGAPGEERDSSAGAIMASALLELSRYVGAADAHRYRDFAVKQLSSLASSAYFSEGDEIGHFLLKHGTGHKPGESEIDVPLDYGDYYFLEALLRLKELRKLDEAAAKTAAALPNKAAIPLEAIGWRIAWRAGGILADLDVKDVIANGEQALASPIPVPSDELFLEYWKNGNRSHYQIEYFNRTRMMCNLAAAEYYEKKGRFLPRLKEVISAICDHKSWTLPAHDWSDGGRGTFNGTYTTTDLVSTDTAAYLANVVQLLGDRLDADLVARIKAEVERRVFAPVRREIQFRSVPGCDPWLCWDSIHWWMNGNNNWNAVCWDNVVTAVEGLVDDRLDRARFIEAAKSGIDAYLTGGFDPDGYCNEGMGYWGYGYGHHLQMGTLLRRVSDGKIDIFTDRRQFLAARYAHEAVPAPLFADVVYQKGCVYGSPRLLAMTEEIWPELKKEPGAVTEFPDAQVWIFRAPEMCVAVKGGNNGDNHNHNDIGSYSVYKNGIYAAGDCGAELYTRFTFSSQRYESKIMNSYGHPVPVVGGKLQSTGRQFHGEIISKKLDGDTSELTVEMKGAYEVPTLKSLRRTFVFDRRAKTFTITDRVEFSEPTAFEDAFLHYEKQDNDNLKVSHANDQPCDIDVSYDVKPEVSVKGGEYEMSEETIANPERLSPRRTGIRFKAPVKSAEVVFVYR